MSQSDTAHAWWSRLRHQGLLLSPVVMIERYPSAPTPASWHAKERLRNAYTRFATTLGDGDERDQAAVLALVDSLVENFIGHSASQFVKQHSIPEKLTVAVRIGTRSETLRPHRILYASDNHETPALLVYAYSSPHVGRGRGRTAYARFLELLRGTGCRLGLLTNGQQFRLVYAGIDFESWCEWESDRWFDDGEGTEELCGLRQLLAAEVVEDVTVGVAGLLSAVEESRKRQADLSSVLRENVRQAVELILEEVSTANRVKADLFTPLARHGDRKLTDAEAYEALMQATVRVVMRLVVCLFAESRQLLPINDPIYASSYGVRSLYELLDEAARQEGGTYVLFNRQTAWPRLMALCRLVHGGSTHGAFPLRPYGGALFRPGDETSDDPVTRALHILEHNVTVGDATIYHVLRKLLRGPLPVLRGRAKTYVEGPVDYTDLRTEFIGLIYEGLLDYRLKRTDEQIGPQIFLNLGPEPVLPLSRLTEMLANDKKSLKDLLTTLRKEKVSATAAEDVEEGEEEAEETEEAEEEATEEEAVEVEAGAEEIVRSGDYLDAVEAAKSWAREAVMLAGIVPKQKKKQTDAEYQTVIEAEANRLIKRVVATGEFYLVRAGNTRKGTGTFYTRPQLAVPTVHRTLEPLCYDKAEDGTLTPKTPEDILGLKVCDPACGSASFLVAALHYLTDALCRSLCHHRNLDDAAQSKRITLPFGRPRTNTEADQLVPFPPDDPQRGDTFEERVKALLRRHVVERCIYGVDINPLAVELARVSLWVETLDPELPFSFLDHKIKVGNSLVGCWLDRVEDYPLKAWEREGGDGPKGERTQRIEEFLKGEKVGNRRTGDGRIKKQMREVIESRFSQQSPLFPDMKVTTESVVTEARADYEKLHDLPVADPDQRECYYREHVEKSPTLNTLKTAMDEWCAIWFWPIDEKSLKHVPTPLTFHKPIDPKDAIVKRLAAEMKFFHWELEFPDVFTPQRSGFDGVLGNPPWETVQQESMEFFTEYDPLYRTYGKQAALARQEELFESDSSIHSHWQTYCSGFAAQTHWIRESSTPFSVALARGKAEKELQTLWARAQMGRIGFADKAHPFRHQGTGKTYSYKTFLEVAHHLLSSRGRLGLIVPSGLYTDAGSKSLRDLFLNHCTWDWLFGFINWEQIFSIYYRFKFVVTIAERHSSPKGHAIRSCFGRYKLRDWEQAESVVFPLPKSNVREFSPKTLSILEITNQRDLDICRKIYGHSFRIGDDTPNWETTYAQEFNMTSDSKHFKPREWWVAQGYRPDVFGRWVNDNDDVALPLYEGRMIGQCDFSQKGHVSGRGRTAKWREIPSDAKVVEPQFLISASSPLAHSSLKAKIAYMRITSATNARSMVATVLKDVPCEANASTITLGDDSFDKYLLLTAILNSLPFDFALRVRFGGITLNWFILEECPLPVSLRDDETATTHSRLVVSTCRMALIHRRFAPEWLLMRHKMPELLTREWKSWWAVNEADRLRLRIENDAIVANLYGLDPNDFDWMLHDDPDNPAGFHRVDKQLPFRERLTGLAASAFRALKEGKWSAESAANLSNDEFFEILGIPELTNAEAAKSKGLPGPLILKRDGCHVWKPENFSEDDPRHGWTWDDCWNDAVALLGSEEAVRQYIAGKPDEPQAEPEYTGFRDLFGDPIIEKPKQRKLF